MFSLLHPPSSPVHVQSNALSMLLLMVGSFGIRIVSHVTKAAAAAAPVVGGKPYEFIKSSIEM